MEWQSGQQVASWHLLGPQTLAGSTWKPAGPARGETCAWGSTMLCVQLVTRHSSERARRGLTHAVVGLRIQEPCHLLGLPWGRAGSLAVDPARTARFLTESGPLRLCRGEER